jgi:hypothetical protein
LIVEVPVDEDDEGRDDVVRWTGGSPDEALGDVAVLAKGPRCRAAATPTNASTITAT